MVEEIVGDIEDEHDEEEAGSLVMLEDGRVGSRRADRARRAGRGGRRAAGLDEDEVDTLGGLVFLLAGHIPVQGECVDPLQRLAARGVDSDSRRILRVRLHAPEPKA